MAKRRADFHELLASLEAQGLGDGAVVGESEDLIGAYNEPVRRHTRAQRARVVVHAITAAEGAAALLRHRYPTPQGQPRLSERW